MGGLIRQKDASSAISRPSRRYATPTSEMQWRCKLQTSARLTPPIFFIMDKDNLEARSVSKLSEQVDELVAESAEAEYEL